VACSGRARQGSGIQVTGVTGGDAAAIGHLDVDKITGNLGIDMWALGFEVMTSGACVGDAIIIELGWGTAECMIDVMCISISISGIYILVGRPFMSVLTGVCLVEVSLGAAHGILPGCLRLVVLCRSAARVARMVVVNIGSSDPTKSKMIHPIQKYLWSFTESHALPRVDQKGQLF
jgi:hypothetical protein